MLNPADLLDIALANTSIPSSTDGSAVAVSVIKPVLNRVFNKSSNNQPILSPSVVNPIINPVLNRVIGSVRIPQAYQLIVRSAVTNAINAVLTASKSSTGATNINTNQFNGSISTKLFSSVRSTILPNAPSYGLSAAAGGELSNSLAGMANTAVASARSAAIQLNGTSVLTADQYSEFTNGATNQFDTDFSNSSYNTQPALQQELTTSQIKLNQSAQAIQASTTQRIPNSTTQSEQTSEDYVSLSTSNYDYKVYLVSALDASNIFVFRAQPVIQVTEAASYSQFSPLHAPGEILSFKHSPARTFAVSEVKLISRTPFEAQENLQYLNMLRAWTKPYFGKSQITPATKERNARQAAVRASAAETTRTLAREQAANAAEVKRFASAAQQATLLRAKPDTYWNDEPVVIDQLNGIVQFSSDPINQSITSAAPVPNVAAAYSRTRTNTKMRQGNPPTTAVTTKLGTAGTGSGPGSASFAAHDPRRIDLSGGAAGYGKGSASFAAFDPRRLDIKTNAGQVAPIVITADSAQSFEPQVIKNTIGSPPEVLYLYGYSEGGKSNSNTRQNLRRIPVVIESLSFTYPNDVDYIPTVEGVPFPTVMNISIGLKEAKSPYELEQFSLTDYRNGKLIGW